MFFGKIRCKGIHFPCHLSGAIWHAIGRAIGAGEGLFICYGSKHVLGASGKQETAFWRIGTEWKTTRQTPLPKNIREQRGGGAKNQGRT